MEISRQVLQSPLPPGGKNSRSLWHLAGATEWVWSFLLLLLETQTRVTQLISHFITATELHRLVQIVLMCFCIIFTTNNH
jgi:hypothetical protein